MFLAAAQIGATADIAENGRRIRDTIRTAAEQGADLVLFPEGALSGYAKSQVKTWEVYDWNALDREIEHIRQHCAALGIYAIIGTASNHFGEARPRNSLLAISSNGDVVARYDKRLLSNTEVTAWYCPGFEPVAFSVGSVRFGLALCIEMQFPELFMEYEAAGVDVVLFGSYGLGPQGEVILRAHAATTCLWCAVATPSDRISEGASGIIGPDGAWQVRCSTTREPTLAVTRCDRSDPRFDIALNKARPWRRVARQGDIYLARKD